MTNRTNKIFSGDQNVNSEHESKVSDRNDVMGNHYTLFTYIFEVPSHCYCPIRERRCGNGCTDSYGQPIEVAHDIIPRLWALQRASEINSSKLTQYKKIL
jgi:hypothetical protein